MSCEVTELKAGQLMMHFGVSAAVFSVRAPTGLDFGLFNFQDPLHVKQPIEHTEEKQRKH